MAPLTVARATPAVAVSSAATVIATNNQLPLVLPFVSICLSPFFHGSICLYKCFRDIYLAVKRQERALTSVHSLPRKTPTHASGSSPLAILRGTDPTGSYF